MQAEEEVHKLTPDQPAEPLVQKPLEPEPLLPEATKEAQAAAPTTTEVTPV